MQVVLTSGINSYVQNCEAVYVGAGGAVFDMTLNKEWLNNGTLGANLIRTARYAIILFTIVGVYPRVFPLFERIGKKSNS